MCKQELEERERELEKMKNAVHQQTTEGEEAITSRECQCCWRAEGDSELRATLTLQREWRKMAARAYNKPSLFDNK